MQFKKATALTLMLSLAVGLVTTLGACDAGVEEEEVEPGVGVEEPLEEEVEEEVEEEE